jgi:hypothetical protein
VCDPLHAFQRSPEQDVAMINADKPTLWKPDIATSVDYYNQWFMKFAPVTYREQRIAVTKSVEDALQKSKDLSQITADILQTHPGTLPTFRMCCCPPLARERLAGLAAVKKTLIEKMEEGVVPPRMAQSALAYRLSQIVTILAKLLDTALFPWLAAGQSATETERHRASTIVADRLCGSMSDPIIRNAQEKRQLEVLGSFLSQLGYKQKANPVSKLLTEMEPGTYAFRMNVTVGEVNKVKIPIDVVIQPKQLRPSKLPILIEAKSAGDFTNVNKRRKEEAKKMIQLRTQFGKDIEYVLFLCGYFNAGYLGYEAAEGMDWVWEHRIEDMKQLGL